MRIYLWVLGLIVAISLIGGGAYLLKEYLIINLAAYKLKNDFNFLKLLPQKENQPKCKNEDRLGSGVTPIGYQLRFENETKYVLETVCDSGYVSTIIKSNRLLGGVARQYGSGVYVLNNKFDTAAVPNAWVHIAYAKYRYVVGLINNQPKIIQQAINLPIGGDTPAIAACNQWGFTCCNNGSQVGIGYKVITADCRQDCYQLCNQRPVVLYFNSSPVQSFTNRTLTLYQNPATVTFGYQIIDDDDSVAAVTLDFGDGQQADNLSNKVENLTHEYSCPAPPCLFTAKLIAADQHGIPAVDTAQNQILIHQN